MPSSLAITNHCYANKRKAQGTSDNGTGKPDALVWPLAAPAAIGRNQLFCTLSDGSARLRGVGTADPFRASERDTLPFWGKSRRQCAPWARLPPSGAPGWFICGLSRCSTRSGYVRNLSIWCGRQIFRSCRGEKSRRVSGTRINRRVSFAKAKGNSGGREQSREEKSREEQRRAEKSREEPFGCAQGKSSLGGFGAGERI